MAIEISEKSCTFIHFCLESNAALQNIQQNYSNNNLDNYVSRLKALLVTRTAPLDTDESNLIS